MHASYLYTPAHNLHGDTWPSLIFLIVVMSTWDNVFDQTCSLAMQIGSPTSVGLHHKQCS